MEDSIKIHDNFFKNPDKVVDLASKMSYQRNEVYPGLRTTNLLESHDSDVREFAKFFAKKIADDVFYGIHNFMIDIRFHKNDIFENSLANQGWIHADPVSLAGLVYLNKSEININSGTSMFIKNSNDDFDTEDIQSRNNFNLTTEVTEDYLNDLNENHNNFIKTTQIGNVYNRLVAYDSKIWHCPNQYKLTSDEQRLSLLFFIDSYQQKKLNSFLSMKSEYEDDF